ncbi:MAG: DNA polymerase III subunit delta [Spirochaetaceae bacterium]|nr:DNA polymerase III subunit delta [Spirochaetaceae bacterium]
MIKERCWLFTGPELGQKKQKIESIKSQIKKDFGEPETRIAYAYETTCFEILNILQSISLFSLPTFIEYRNAELIKDKTEITLLHEWLGSAAEGINFLVLTSDEISVDKKLDSLFSSGQKQIFWELFENKKQDWIRSFFSQHGISITNDAIETILDQVENNTDALKAQCQHFALFFEDTKKIEQKDIENLLSHNKAEDVFTLFDSLTRGETEKSFDILSTLLLTKNISAVQLTIGLASCFRRLRDFQQYLIATGEKPTEPTMRRFGITSKKAISQYERSLKRWPAPVVQDILYKINTCDFDVRKQAQPLHSMLLEMLLLYIAERS